jgi:hypothetical protein
MIFREGQMKPSHRLSQLAYVFSKVVFTEFTRSIERFYLKLISNSTTLSFLNNLNEQCEV